MSKEAELKPCPFCGGNAVLKHSVFVRFSAFVICKNCGVRTMEYTSNSLDDAKMLAMQIWNRRV